MAEEDPDSEKSDKSKDGSDFDEVEEWGEESFPASDPPAAWSGPPED